MKQKSLYLLLFLYFGVFTFSRAQDFKPSEQAQGYLNAKNVLVDYVTGTFHYKIPLFELNVGNYNLPLSLTYSSMGLEKDTPPTMVGVGWNLDVGGVVTRLIRGGCADEKLSLPEGLIHLDSVNVYYASSRAEDGEADLFTAVFGGQLVTFVIRKSGNRICAVSLEKTNVRIECEQSGWTITGWKVTDENGIRYIYREAEVTKEIVEEQGSSFGNIAGENYVSSWYLSEIQVPNSGCIYYDYDPLCALAQDGGGYIEPNLVRINKSSYISYEYGIPILRYTMGTWEDSRTFNEAISNAMAAIDDYTESLREVWNNWNDRWIGRDPNPDWEAVYDNIKLQEQLLGIVNDHFLFAEASINLIHELERWYDYYDSLGQGRIAGYFFDAKLCLDRMLKHMEETSFGSAYQSSRHTIYSPRLRRIRCGDKVLCFEYSTLKDPYRLSRVKLLDYNRNELESVVFTVGNELSKLEWKGGEGDVTRTMFFSSTENRVLSEIRFSMGGSVKIAYEKNQGTNTNIEGLRVKSIVTFDGEGHSDSLMYSYPGNGIFVYDDAVTSEKIQYKGFFDIVSFQRVKYLGFASVNTGNHGIFYPYVEERVVGKGTNTYLFSVPQAVDRKYPYWLCDLLLARGVYDEAEKLVRLECNTYLSDVSGRELNVPAGKWFEQVPEILCYGMDIRQTQAYSYWFDSGDIWNSYMEQKEEMEENGIYGMGYGMDMEMLYEQNIAPRSTIVMPDLKYTMELNGKTLPREQKVYCFDGTAPVGISREHLTGNLPAGAFLESHVRYEYDNPAYSLAPTRVIEKLSGGDERVTLRYTAADFKPGASAMTDSMKAANVVAVPVKERLVVKDGVTGTCVLAGETVYTFVNHPGEHGTVILPEKEFDCINVGQTVVLPPVAQTGDNRQTSLYSYPTGEYGERVSLVYTRKGNRYYPVQTNTVSGVTAVCHESWQGNLRPSIIWQESLSGCNEPWCAGILPSRSNLLLEAMGVDSSRVDALQVGNFTSNAIFNDSWNYFSARMENLSSLKGIIADIRNAPYSFGTDLCYACLDGMLDDFENFIDRVLWVFNLWEPLDISDLVEKYQELMRYYKLVNDSSHNWIDIWDPLEDNSLYDYDSNYNLEFYCDFEMVRETLTFLNDLCWGEMSFDMYELFGRMSYGDAGPFEARVPLKITSPSGGEVFQVFAYVRSSVAEAIFPCRYFRGAQSTAEQKHVSVLPTGEWQLVVFDVVTPATGNVTSIEVDVPAGLEIAAAIMVPRGTPFAAYGYNADGSVFCKFDHNRMVERYEYDSARRLSRLLDKDGNLLKEFDYNFLK